MNLETKDKIFLGDDDLKNLLAWRDNNKDLVRNFKPSLDEGVILFKGHYKQYFLQEDNIVHFKIYVANQLYFQFSLNRDSRTPFNLDFKPIFSEMGIVKKEAIQDAITVHASIMAYMQSNKEYVEVKEIEKLRKKQKKKNKDKRKNKNYITKIKTTVYKVNVANTEQQRKEKYEKHIESWGVRGHFRTLKSGNKVWIKPYVKGEGKTNPKTYKM